MITPGNAPDGAYVPGASFGPDNRGVSVNDAVDAAKAQMTAPYLNTYGNLGDILLNTLNGVLQAVVDGIIAGAQAVGMIVTGIFDTIAGAIQWVVDGIAAIFGGGNSENYTPGSMLAIAADKQLELNNRLDLMEDVSGYICTYMGQNRYKDRNKWNLMEFNRQLGPEKNAELITSGSYANSIWLAKGTWVISAQIAHDQHVDRRASRMRLTCVAPWAVSTDNPDGIISTKESHQEVLPDKGLTIPLQHTVVVSEDAGAYVFVTSWYSVGTFVGIYTRLRYLGGTHLTHLTAHRLDLNTANAVREEDVPTVGSDSGNDG